MLEVKRPKKKDIAELRAIELQILGTFQDQPWHSVELADEAYRIAETLAIEGRHCELFRDSQLEELRREVGNDSANLTANLRREYHRTFDLALNANGRDEPATAIETGSVRHIAAIGYLLGEIKRSGQSRS